MLIRHLLGKDSTEALLKLPETGPGFQIVVDHLKPEALPLLIFNAEVMIEFTSIEGISSESDSMFSNGLLVVNALLNQCRDAISSSQLNNFKLQSIRIESPGSHISSTTPKYPLVTSSTIVKTLILNNPLKFHRFSPFYPDRRIDQKTGNFLPGTYVTPDSEVALTPTGLAAVGRFALPYTSPASWHYVAEASVGTTVSFGTVAPAFGHAGGGVEAYLVNGTNNTNSFSVPFGRIPDF